MLAIVVGILLLSGINTGTAEAPAIESYPELIMIERNSVQSQSLPEYKGNSLLASGMSFISRNFDFYGAFAGQEDIEYLFAQKDPILRKLAYCESSLNPQAVGRAGEIGLYQYLSKTWQWFNSIRGTNLDIYNPEHQIEMTEWALNQGFQKHWTCWKHLDK